MIAATEVIAKKHSWQDDIMQLGEDFGIHPFICMSFIISTITDYGQRETPDFYKGDRQAFFYDKTYTKLRDYLMENL